MLTRRDKAPPSDIQVIPAVDVLDGRAVRLRQGRFSERFLDGGDPLALIARYSGAGASLIHLVDLEGARAGKPDLDLIEGSAEAAGESSIQVGGGIRSLHDAEAALAAGAKRVVMGTAALASPTALEELAGSLGEQLVVAVDVRDQEVLSHAWQKGTGRSINEVLGACEAAGVIRVLCTAVERDGTHEGPNLELLGKIAVTTDLKVIASGGVGTREDITALANLSIEACVVGRALLDGSLPLSTIQEGSKNKTE
jgi:phosphoribosylformimino-5-aminoimidazole carboxamide ribotide isomerase